MSATVLYTPEVLALATGLSEFGWDDGLPLRGEARSRSCGSSLSLGLSLDNEGRVEKVGLKSHACAIGQAAASIFAKSACGRTLDEIASSARSLEGWLGGKGEIPEWPGLAAIAAARDYPARHPAIMLAWKAASELLPSR
jgi:NifU-like protein involved in Fe-S cluster formation